MRQFAESPVPIRARQRRDRSKARTRHAPTLADGVCDAFGLDPLAARPAATPFCRLRLASNLPHDTRIGPIGRRFRVQRLNQCVLDRVGAEEIPARIVMAHEEILQVGTEPDLITVGVVVDVRLMKIDDGV